MHNKRHICVPIVAGLAALAVALPVSAKDFYKGKTLSVIINYSAGGNTDIQGRSLLRYMENYIPGKPRVIVKNMPGAGGVVATNYMGEAAKRDGSVMGIFTIAIMPELMGDPSLRVKHKDFQYIGAIGQQQIAHCLKSLAPTLQDFLHINKPFKSAGHAPNNSKDISIYLTLGMLGIKHNHVTGFKSAGAIRRALLQNEVQYTEDSVTGYYAAVVPTLVKPGLDIPLWHTGVVAKDGTMKRSPSMDKSIPAFIDVYKMKFGKDAVPKGLAWDAFKVIAGTRQFLRILLLPPGAPKAALAALTEAWAKTTKDKGYLAEYHKQNDSDLDPLIGNEAQEAISNVLDIKPALRTYLLDLSKKIAG